MLPQHGAVWKFIVNLLSDGNIGQQHELLHHGVCLPNNQVNGCMLKTQHDTNKHTEKKETSFCGGKEFCSFFEATYISSLVWRSMGSWVSLSMWKRTSKDDSVNALKDFKYNTKHNSC